MLCYSGEPRFYVWIDEWGRLGQPNFGWVDGRGRGRSEMRMRIDAGRVSDMYWFCIR